MCAFLVLLGKLFTTGKNTKIFDYYFTLHREVFLPKSLIRIITFVTSLLRFEGPHGTQEAVASSVFFAAF